jgi:DNA polymerase-3 subunit delta'
METVNGMFDQIVGHERQRALLAGAVARDALPPALLLAGPAGVGKRRTAGALAQLLNCLSPVGTAARPDACGACTACQRIARGVHPDALVLAPADHKAISVEAVREVIEKAAYRPFEGRRRVVVIDDADELGVPAQHALLKTLEEPPSASVFVLVSSRADTLLATVRSRCSRLRFGPLTRDEVAGVLVRDHGVTPDEARVRAAEAGGSVGVALALEAADLSAARELAADLLDRVARASDPARRLEAVKGLPGNKKRTAAEERAQLSACLRAAGSMLRDVCALDAGADPGALANADLAPALERLRTGFDTARAARAFTVVDRALGALERNASPKVVAGWLAVRL